eukprot:6613136-Prymnesium_polylepis.1
MMCRGRERWEGQGAKQPTVAAAGAPAAAAAAATAEPQGAPWRRAHRTHNGGGRSAPGGSPPACRASGRFATPEPTCAQTCLLYTSDAADDM